MKIAIVATDGFEEAELSSPKAFLEKQGWTTKIVSIRSGSIKAWNHNEWSKDYPVDLTIEEASGHNFDALVLPGGVMNPDRLRTYDEVIRFISTFFGQDKPVAAICHGPQLLINAGVVRGRTLTSVKSVSIDLINAGANWIDAEVVTDKGLTTSRTPDDLPAFNARIAEEFYNG